MEVSGHMGKKRQLFFTEESQILDAGVRETGNHPQSPTVLTAVGRTYSWGAQMSGQRFKERQGIPITSNISFLTAVMLTHIPQIFATPPSKRGSLSPTRLECGLYLATSK